jgi:predicted nuclease of predicted toxin-antitoxin system
VRILANENIAGVVVQTLRAQGHDVLFAKESMRGEKDPAILQRAQAERRIVLTCDRDFGELAVRRGIPAECGVVLLRLSGSNPDTDNTRAVAALTSRGDWAGQFAVVTHDRIRLRPLPRIREP